MYKATACHLGQILGFFIVVDYRASVWVVHLRGQHKSFFSH